MKIKDFLYWGLIAGLLGFVLYQKGMIFAPFQSIEPKEAYQYIDDNNVTFLDVRTLEELKTDGMIADAIHIPLDQLSNKLEILAPYKKRRLIVYCRSGSRSVSASRILTKANFQVYNLSGGINAWKAAKLETIRP